MRSEIFENEFDFGVIEYEGNFICKISKIKITKVFKPNMIKHIFMEKVYQNNNQKEHDEIDEYLINIFKNDDYFTVLCSNDNNYVKYNCKFDKKPLRGNYNLSAEVI